MRAPAVETHAARWGAVEYGVGPAGAHWAGTASLGKGVAALWMPPSSRAAEPVPLDEAPLGDDGGAWWDDAQVDPLDPGEQAAAAEEERAMWRALLSAVSESGEVAVQFRDLVGEDDNEVRFLFPWCAHAAQRGVADLSHPPCSPPVRPRRGQRPRTTLLSTSRCALRLDPASLSPSLY